MDASERLSISAAYKELRQYRFVWKMGFYLLLAVTLVPVMIFAVFSSNVLKDGGAIFLLLGMSAVGLYTLRDLYNEIAANVRARRLALLRNMDYLSDFYPKGLPGLVFRSGMYVPRALRTRQPLFVEFGLMRPGSGTRRTNHSVTFTYMRAKLPKVLPQMLLRRTQGVSYLRSFNPESGRIKLEGSFGDQFDLFAPKDYQVDALYIFTPDVMERFLDKPYKFDCEIVNDEMYFYIYKKIDVTKVENLQTMLDMLNTVLQKFERQSSRYVDERPALDADGRRSDIIRFKKPSVGVLFLILYVALLITGFYFKFQ